MKKLWQVKTVYDYGYGLKPKQRFFETTTFPTTNFICLIIFPIHLEITNKSARIMKNMLNEMFTRISQNQFRKDGLKKRAFKDAKHCKCLIGNGNLF